jgi:hypothetical protein
MATARKGPVAPESKKQSAPKGPSAVKGPQVSPSVLEDARRQGAKSESVEIPQERKAESRSVEVVDSNTPFPTPQFYREDGEGVPAQPFNLQEVQTTSTGAEPGGKPPTSRSPIAAPEEVWEAYPEVRFDPSNPAVQAQTYVQPATGAVAEKLVGQVSEDQELRPAGSTPLGGTTTGRSSTSPEEPPLDQ